MAVCSAGTVSDGDWLASGSSVGEGVLSGSPEGEGETLSLGETEVVLLESAGVLGEPRVTMGTMTSVTIRMAATKSTAEKT